MDLLMKKYDIDAVSYSHIGYSMNDVYRIQTDSLCYCLRIHNPCDKIFGSGIFSKSSFDFEMSFLNDLYNDFLSRGIILQKPIADCSGSFVIELPNNRFATMVTWVEGKSIVLDEATENDYYNIGKLLASLHKFSSKYVADSGIHRQYFDEKRVDMFIERIKDGYKSGIYNRKIIDIVTNESGEIVNRIKELYQMEKTMGIIHGDFYLYNLIKSGTSIIPIDFGLCTKGFYYQDLASICNEQNDYNLQNRFLEAYQEHMGMNISKRYLSALQGYLTLFFLAGNYQNPDDYSWLETLLYE